MSEKGQRFLCGQKMKAGEGFLLYEASSTAAHWLHTPSWCRSPLPQFWVTARAVSQTEGLFCLEWASLTAQLCKQLLLCSQTPGPLSLTPRWWGPCCAWEMVTLGPHGGVWGHGMKRWHEHALLIRVSTFTESKSILCPEAWTDNITQLVPTLLFFHSQRHLCKYFSPLLVKAAWVVAVPSPPSCSI